MARYLLYLLIAIALLGGAYLTVRKNGYAWDAATLERGRQLFTMNCSACHGLEAEGFGPPLGGVTKLFSEKELINFIRNPTKAIEAGDPRAVKLHERYKQVMPSFEQMEEAEIRAMLAYIHRQSELHDIPPLSMDRAAPETSLTGRLVAPVKKSGLKITLEKVIQIPRIASGSSNLGIVTLRPHPSGDGTLFVSDQNGVIYQIRGGKAAVFLDVRAHVRDFQSGPGISTGIASFDFHPNFSQNGLFYMLHAETYKGQAVDYYISDSLRAEVQWVLVEWKMQDVTDSLFRGSHRELLRLHAPTFAHGAQDMGFIPGLEKNHPEYGFLYFGFGDGGANNIGRPELGHHAQSFLGTILRIDPTGNNSPNGKYGIPADNPFANETHPATVREIYAYGFRNPHRLAWDPSHGNRMIATDIGEANIEEINVIEKGGDYGWPKREGMYGITTTRDMKTVYLLAQSDQELYKMPFAQYDHAEGNAISGGYVYDGELAALKNKYIFGDIVTGRLFYTHIDPLLSDSAIYELAILHEGKEMSLREMSGIKRMHMRVAYDHLARQLYVITKADGNIWRVSGVNRDRRLIKND